MAQPVVHQTGTLVVHGRADAAAVHHRDVATGVALEQQVGESGELARSLSEERDALQRWTILLAIFTFTLSLMGTFLVRSGILSSVHAFANDPERGIFILALLAIALVGSMTLFALRAPRGCGAMR